MITVKTVDWVSLFLRDPKLKLGENERVEFSTVSEVGAFAKSCRITGPSSEVDTS